MSASHSERLPDWKPSWHHRWNEVLTDPRSQFWTLHSAAVLEASDVARILLQESAAVDERDKWGRGALHYAVTGGSTVVAELLLAAGADADLTDSTGRSTLHYAVMYGTPDAVRLLLERGARTEAVDGQGLTPLHCAAMIRDPLMVRRLLDGGAGVNSRDARGKAPLHLAVARGRALRPNEDRDSVWPPYGVRAGGQTIFESPGHGVVLALLESGADIAARDRDGRTPILDVATGSADLLGVLLRHGASIHEQDMNGFGLLHRAVIAGRENPEYSQETLAWLGQILAQGADPNLPDSAGRVPLHYALERENGWSVLVGKCLVNAGSDVNARDREGVAPFDLVRDIPQLEILAKALASQVPAAVLVRLGDAFSTGGDPKADYKSAAKWYRRAAECNDPAAQYRLGVLHQQGLGVRQDASKAALYFRAAAEQGHQRAALALKSLGPVATEVEASPPKGRFSLHCYSCRRRISRASLPTCRVCDWVLCTCGACGCDYREREG